MCRMVQPVVHIKGISDIIIGGGGVCVCMWCECVWCVGVVCGCVCVCGVWVCVCVWCVGVVCGVSVSLCVGVWCVGVVFVVCGVWVLCL
jgi:hypothetical protein